MRPSGRAPGRCPTREELGRGLRRGEPHALQQHVQDCATCTHEVDALSRLGELARAMPSPREQGRDLEESRAQLLALAEALSAPRARHRHLPRTVALAVPLLLAAAIALVAWTSSSRSAGQRLAIAMRVVPAPPPVARVVEAVRRGTVRAEPGASYAWSGSQPDEQVRLHDGAVHVEVSPLHAGERFRVIVGDAEVEVRGTAFDVVVIADRLIAVHVSHGRVEVRHTGDPAVMLEAGARWDGGTHAVPAGVPPIAAAAPAHLHAERPASESATAVLEPVAPTAGGPTPSAPTPAGPSTSPMERAFQEGIASLRDGDPAAAALAFQRAMLTPGGALLEDARFWLAVARARNGQPLLAIHAFEDFLDRHPRSLRAGKASAMLGWLLLHERDVGGAERRFRAALTDGSEAVRASARAGLAALPKSD